MAIEAMPKSAYDRKLFVLRLFREGGNKSEVLAILRARHPKIAIGELEGLYFGVDGRQGSRSISKKPCAGKKKLFKSLVRSANWRKAMEDKVWHPKPKRAPAPNPGGQLINTIRGKIHSMGWKEKMDELAQRVRERDDFVVVHHYDADGCSSGAIMYKALLREGKKATKRWVKQLYKETILEIRGLGKNYVFVDFGSGQLGYLKEEFGDNLFVFDHHQKTEVQHPNHFTPFDFGINGGNEISASGIAYLFAKALNKKNIDLLPLALVGAVGDVQDFSGKLIGLNAEIVKEGSEAGIVRVEKDLRLYGRVTRPLVQFLMYSTSPMLPELTANEQNCIRFLRENKIEPRETTPKGGRARNYIDLSKEEKSRLSTALILHLDKFGVPEWKIGELFGEVYSFPAEDIHSPCSEAKEFSTLCNACGRHGEADIAIGVCMGDRGAKYHEALLLMAEHRRQLRDGIEFVLKSGLQERAAFYYFDASGKIEESIVGIVAGMLYGSNLVVTNKPIIAIASNDEGGLKISGRATKDLVRAGINLGMAFREVCGEIGDGSEGGGHAIAAGLKLEKRNLEAFLQKLDTKLCEQAATGHRPG